MRTVRTKYAKAERASRKEIENQAQLFIDNELLNEFIGSINTLYIILNEYRQIVFMNKRALEFIGLDDISSAFESRLGEILGCIHSTEEEGGCGTSEACTYCGVVNACLESQTGESTVADCRLVIGSREIDNLDLRIWASPLTIRDNNFIALTMQDISSEKRREVLERVFFHDILNTAGILLNEIEFSEKYKDKINLNDRIGIFEGLTKRLIEEIQSQQILGLAENKKLSINITTVNSLTILDELISNYAHHDLAKDKNIRIDENTVSIDFSIDRNLLQRVLDNMVKNALEATSKGDTITVGSKVNNNKIHFWVHNSTFIPRDVQLQIFYRSFSTKGKGRGIGTYGMKLLSDYLDGDVTFTTSEEKGTIFTASYPLKLKN